MRLLPGYGMFAKLPGNKLVAKFQPGAKKVDDMMGGTGMFDPHNAKYKQDKEAADYKEKTDARRAENKRRTGALMADDPNNPEHPDHTGMGR